MIFAASCLPYLPYSPALSAASSLCTSPSEVALAIWRVISASCSSVSSAVLSAVLSIGVVVGMGAVVGAVVLGAALGAAGSRAVVGVVLSGDEASC